MDYPEDNEQPINPDLFAKEPPYVPGDRFMARLDQMTRESYEYLAEADLVRRLVAIERRVAILEYAFNMRGL